MEPGPNCVTFDPSDRKSSAWLDPTLLGTVTKLPVRLLAAARDTTVLNWELGVAGVVVALSSLKLIRVTAEHFPAQVSERHPETLRVLRALIGCCKPNGTFGPLGSLRNFRATLCCTEPENLWRDRRSPNRSKATFAAVQQVPVGRVLRRSTDQRSR